MVRYSLDPENPTKCKLAAVSKRLILLLKLWSNVKFINSMQVEGLQPSCSLQGKKLLMLMILAVCANSY